MSYRLVTADDLHCGGWGGGLPVFLYNNYHTHLTNIGEL